jgi:hypothetical protein
MGPHRWYYTTTNIFSSQYRPETNRPTPTSHTGHRRLDLSEYSRNLTHRRTIPHGRIPETTTWIFGTVRTTTTNPTRLSNRTSNREPNPTYLLVESITRRSNTAVPDQPRWIYMTGQNGRANVHPLVPTLFPLTERFFNAGYLSFLSPLPLLVFPKWNDNPKHS